MITKMQTYFLKSLRIFIIFFLSACNFPDSGKALPQTIETAQNYESVECAFVWANDSLPELSNDFNEALKIVHPEAEGYAQAYFENCVTAEGEVVRFHVMETDFYITLKVNDLGDKEVLGNRIKDVLDVMAAFPTLETPGPQPGYIEITFESPENELRLWLMRTEIETAYEKGLRGSELFNALQSK
jgi:hypothetical protein